MKKTNFTFLKGLAVSAMMAVGIANVSAQGLGCQDFVNVSLDGTCGVILTPATFGAGTTGTVVTIKDGTNVIAGPAATLTVPNASAWIGKTYTFEVAASAAPGANKCWGSVKFEDKLGPVFVCPAATAPGGSAATALTLTCANSAITAPTATDCSAIVSNTFSDVTAGSLCAGTATLVRTYTAVDFYHNSNVRYFVSYCSGVVIRKNGYIIKSL